MLLNIASMTHRFTHNKKRDLGSVLTWGVLSYVLVTSAISFVCQPSVTLDKNTLKSRKKKLQHQNHKNHLNVPSGLGFFCRKFSVWKVILCAYFDLDNFISFVCVWSCLTPSSSLLNNYNDHNVCLVRKSMVMHQRFTVITFTTATYTTVEEVFKLHGWSRSIEAAHMYI